MLITWLEIIWIVVASIGLIFQLASVRRTVGDLYIVKDRGINGIRKFTAETSVLIFVGGALVQMTYLSVGIWALSRPRPLHIHLGIINYVPSIILLLGSVMAMVFGAIIYRRRIKVVDMLKEGMK